MAALREEIDAASAHYAGARYDDAIAAYRRALELAPGNAALVHNLGVALAASGRVDEAGAALATAVALAPEGVASWLALGHLEFGRDRLDAAEAAFAAAARLAPDSVEAQYNLGYARHERGRFHDALPPLVVARARAPASEQAWYQLYNTRLALGDREGALADFLEFEPHAVPTAAFLRAALESARMLGEENRESKVVGQVLAHAFGVGNLEALAGCLMRLQYFDVARADLRRLYDTYDRLMRERIGAETPLASPSRRPGRTRVGYVSADFREHIMGRLLQDVISAHDRDRYEIRLYSLAPPSLADAATDRFRALADRFVELPRRELDAARAIAADDCDVLVDLAGHTTFSRPGILARKPARRIVTHLGSHGAVGLSQVDFKLTDRHADVADAARYQIERPLAMAGCVLPFRRARRSPATAPTRAGLGLAPEALVLGEFVTVQKLSPRCLALWRTILERVPGAVLLFSPNADTDRAAFRRRLAGFGIDPSRAAFVVHPADEAESAARYEVVDLVLDTLPYTGGDTTLAALDAGVPVVTLAGTRHAERMASSILLHAGLPELVAESETDYVEFAVALASDPERRARVSAAVTERYAAAAARYPAGYARDLEAALDAAIATPPSSSAP